MSEPMAGWTGPCGKSNSFEVPCSRNKSPITTRAMLSISGAYLLTRSSDIDENSPQPSKWADPIADYHSPPSQPWETGAHHPRPAAKCLIHKALARMSRRCDEYPAVTPL